MARKHSKHGLYEEPHREEEERTATVAPFGLCGCVLGKSIVWHHPVPKSRGGRDVVPMHPICQQISPAYAN